jgi:paraquat-inducible protein B
MKQKGLLMSVHIEMQHFRYQGSNITIRTDSSESLLHGKTTAYNHCSEVSSQEMSAIRLT